MLSAWPSGGDKSLGIMMPMKGKEGLLVSGLTSTELGSHTPSSQQEKTPQRENKQLFLEN